MRTAAEVALRAFKAYGEDSCAVFAGGITYYALLSLFPLMLFALSIAAFFFTSADEQQRLVDNLLDSLPLDSASGRDDLEDVIAAVVDARGTLGIVGLVGAAYSGSALFGAVRTALNAVVHASKRRNFALGKALDLAQVFLFTVLLLVSVGITVGIALVQRFSEDWFGSAAAAWVDRLLAVAWALLPTAASMGMFVLLFTYVPARRMGLRNAAWGALVAAVLFEVLKLGFTQYVSNFGNYNATYGALGFVIILLVFFNFTSQIVLLGAEVARVRADMENDGAARFRETEALGGKLRSIASRIPGVNIRGATARTGGAVPAGEASPAPVAGLEASAIGVPRIPGSGVAGAAPRPRPGSLAVFVMLAGACFWLAGLLRRR